MEKSKNCIGECPKCGSTDIDYLEGFIEDDYYCYVCVCNKCDTTFREWYSLHYAETVYEEEENNENL